MGKAERRVCSLLGCTVFLPLVIVCCVLFVAGLSERRKLNTYVQGDCLVTSASLDKYAVMHSKAGEQQYYRWVWGFEYLQYQTDKQTTITHSGNYLKLDTSWEVRLQKELENYQV